MFRLLRYTLLSVILSACTANLKVSETRPVHYELKALKSDSASLDLISPYKTRLDAEMRQVIAYSDSALTREGFESSLGNFVCLAVEEFTMIHKPGIAGSSVIILNRGGLRNNLPMGEITKGNVFELMPFDNEIVILNLSGQKLQQCINAMLRERKLISHHLQMKVEDKMPQDIFVNKMPFDINRNYFVVTTDYLAMGGDNCSFFANPVSYMNTGVKLRDAIIAYCESFSKNKKTISPIKFGNIRISK